MLDFILNLLSNKFNTIITATDKFIKYIIFVLKQNT